MRATVQFVHTIRGNRQRRDNRARQPKTNGRHYRSRRHYSLGRFRY